MYSSTIKSKSLSVSALRVMELKRNMLRINSIGVAALRVDVWQSSKWRNHKIGESFFLKKKKKSVLHCGLAAFSFKTLSRLRFT